MTGLILIYRSYGTAQQPIGLALGWKEFTNSLYEHRHFHFISYLHRHSTTIFWAQPTGAFSVNHLDHGTEANRIARLSGEIPTHSPPGPTHRPGNYLKLVQPHHHLRHAGTRQLFEMRFVHYQDPWLRILPGEALGTYRPALICKYP